MSSQKSTGIPLQPFPSEEEERAPRTQSQTQNEDPDAITSSIPPPPQHPRRLSPDGLRLHPIALTLDQVLNHLLTILPTLDERIDRDKASKQMQSDVWMAETKLRALREKFGGREIDGVVGYERERVECVRVILGRLAWGVSTQDKSGICAEMHCPPDETFNAPEMKERMYADGFWPPREVKITAINMFSKSANPEDDDDDNDNTTSNTTKKSLFKKAQPPSQPKPKEEPSPLKQFLADLESLRKELKPAESDQRAGWPRAWKEGLEKEKRTARAGRVAEGSQARGRRSATEPERSGVA